MHCIIIYKWLIQNKPFLAVCEFYGNHVKEHSTVSKRDPICSCSINGNSSSIQSDHRAQYLGVMILHLLYMKSHYYLWGTQFHLPLTASLILCTALGKEMLLRGFPSLHPYSALARLLLAAQNLHTRLVSSQAHPRIVFTILLLPQLHLFQVLPLITWYNASYYWYFLLPLSQIKRPHFLFGMSQIRHKLKIGNNYCFSFFDR